MVKILYVTTAIESPPTHGSQIRRWNIFQGLLAAGSTDVLVFCQSTDPDQAEVFAGCRSCTPVDATLLESSIQHARYQSTIGRGMLALTSTRPFEFQYPKLAQLRAEVSKRIDFSQYDVIWFNTAHTAMAFRDFAHGVSILDGDDFDYVREHALLWSSPWYGAKLFNYLNVIKLWWWERSWAKVHNVVIRCSNEDCDRHPAPNVVAIPNGAGIPDTYPRTPERRLLFVGLLSYPPNSEAMHWFLAKIWPRIRSQVPDAECDIVGRYPPAFITQQPAASGIIAHGFVRELAPFYQRAAATIAPLRAGSGTRLKILESLAHAVPVVSTSLGAFGIPAGLAEGLSRCDSEELFAAACIDRLCAPEQHLGAAIIGREFVRNHYDWNAIQAQVAELVHQVSRSHRADCFIALN